MRIFEVEGDSPDEIIALFVKQQAVPKDYIEYEVLDNGSKGILGLGKRPARLKIKYNDGEHLKRKSRVVLADLLDKAGFSDAHIEVKGTENKIILDINTQERPDILIGKTAQTLDAIQYLMDKMLKTDESSDVELVIDVGGYRERAVAQNVERALKLAEQVKITGNPARMQPMPASMRKAVHIAIKGVSGVSTISIGEGQLKQINIVPEKKR